MDKDKEKVEAEEVSEEEKESEAEALKEVKEEELKSKLAEDLGVDPEDEPELFEKLLKREQTQREKLSGAIKQKINWREKASETTKEPEVKPKDGKPLGEPVVLSEELLEQKLNEREAKRDLENLDLPEDVEAEIKDLAKVKGISIKEAAKLPYITSRIEEAEKEKRIQSATPKRKGRGSYAPVADPSKPLDPTDFDLGSKKGRKAWANAKSARREFEKQQ